MPENNYPASDRTVVVNPNRLSVLTIVSLAFNALILLLLLIGLVCHHHREKEHGDMENHHHHDGGFERGGWNGRGFERHGPADFERHGPGGMHRGGEMGRDEERGPGRDREEGRGWGGREGRGGMEGRERGGMGPMQPPTAPEITDRLMKHLDTQLQLTEPENTQIRPIIEQQVAQMQKDMEARRQAHEKMMDDTTAKIRPLLTADQQKLLDQMKARKDEKAHEAEQKTGAAPAKPKA